MMPRSIFSSALVLLLAPAFAFAQFRTVTVQNANDNPVPATIQNTPSVNVANTPTVSVSGTVNAAIAGTPSVNATITGTPAVSATITGTPSVTVTGTPAVSVANLPTGTAGPAATTALATKSLDNPALQPFQKQVTCAAVGSCMASFTVPAGKQLVIEYLQFTSFENDPNANPTYDYSLQTAAGGQALIYTFAPGVRLRPNNPLGEHQVRIYADPGSTVFFSGLASNNTAAISYFATLSGHLVNVP
jgi:hypothetical protein